MIARTSFEQEHRCRLAPPQPAWLRILVLFGVSAAVLCHAQTIAPPDAGGLKVGLYKDGQLIDTLADLAPAPAADLVSSRGIALHSPAVPGGQTLPAAPALSAETQARNAAFARTAQSAVTLRDLLEGLATTAQADTTGPRAELAMRFQDFLDSTADSRAALDRTGQRLAELKLDPVIAARHAQTVAAFEQRLAEFQDRIHDAVYGRPGAVQAALDFLDEAKFVSRPSLDKASPTVQVHVLNAPELTREEADALLEGQAGTETGTQSAPETAPSTPPTQTQPAALLPAPVLQPPRPATQAQPGVGKPTRAEAPSANRGASAGRARTSRPVSPSADPATPTTESRSAASTVPQGAVPRRGRGIELAGGPPPAPDDLLPTIDVQITQAILDKAAALGNSPLAIYEFVRNNVQFQPYLGSRKGSAFTLQQLAGNDTDQASLLLALLRAAGVPCRYVRGSVEMTPEQATSWLGVDDAHTAGSILTTAGLDGLNIVDGGGNVIAIRCTRVWVEAYVPYANYRGVPNDDTGKIWIPLDPAFKGTIITPGEDVLALMGWDADAFLADYISTFHDPSPIEKLLEDVQAWLDINRPGQTVADIERRIDLDELELGLLPASLPYQARSVTSRFATLEDAKRYQVRFHLYSGGTTFINQTLNVLDLAGRKLTIHYVGATSTDQATIDAYGGIYNTPPNLVNVKPVLKLDDVVIATSPNAIGMGRTHSSDMHFLHPTGDNNVQPLVQNQITAGNSQAIAFDTFLDTYDMFLAGIDIPAGPVVEGLLHPTAADYLSRVDAGLENAAALMRIVPMSDISEAIVESAIKVTYSMGGTPLTFEWTGMIVDADRRIVGVFPVDGDDTKQVPYMKLTGYDGSIMENRVFEDLYGQRAISTIKVLALANDLGINACTITYSIAAQCPGFSHPSSVTSAVNAALAQGHHVTIPRAPITVGLWSGTGYIDMNPATGAAGYIISGGISGNITVSGGATVDQWSEALPCNATAVTCVASSISPPNGSKYCANNASTQITCEATLSVTCEGDPPTTATQTVGPRTYNARTIATTYGAGDYTFTVSHGGVVKCSTTFTIYLAEFSKDEEIVCWRQNGTFDAKALLTPKSTRDNTQLSWTISPSTASIDSTGTITFGTNGDKYTVGVTAAGIPGCSDSFDVLVLSIDIVDPEEGDVHLVGEEVKFDGELEPTGLSGVTYAWSVLEGTCDSSIATTEDFETTLKSEGTIKVKLQVTVGATTCEKERIIKAVLPEVTKLSWNNDHAMTKWGGSAITDPVWVKTLGGALTKSEPGTYTKDGEATAELEIEGDSPLTHSTSVQVKGDGNTENFYPEGATFHNWTWSSGELELDSSPLYASVNFYDTLDVTWYYRVEKLAGGWGDWVEMNESTHLLYTVDATPATSPLYDRGVDKACRYANGASDFAGEINTGLADDLLYEPTGCTSHDLGIFDVGSGQCCCHASVFSVLISHVTSSSPATEDCWGGCSSSTHCHFKYSGWWGPTFQCQRPVEDSVDANPHFNFHVQVPYNGTVYDPSYGLTGWAPLLETAPAIPTAHPNAAVFQSGSWPPATAHAVDWTCPH